MFAEIAEHRTFFMIILVFQPTILEVRSFLEMLALVIQNKISSKKIDQGNIY